MDLQVILGNLQRLTCRQVAIFPPDDYPDVQVPAWRRAIGIAGGDERDKVAVSASAEMKLGSDFQCGADGTG
jgi:hypothetical protein